MQTLRMQSRLHANGFVYKRCACKQGGEGGHHVESDQQLYRFRVGMSRPQIREPLLLQRRAGFFRLYELKCASVDRQYCDGTVIPPSAVL